MSIYDKYRLSKFLTFFLLCFSLVGIYEMEQDWISYLLHSKDCVVKEAEIEIIKKEALVTKRMSSDYTYFCYSIENNKYSEKMLTSMTDYFKKPEEKIKIGVYYGKPVRLKPVIPTFDTGNLYIFLIYVANIISLVYYVVYTKKYKAEAKREVINWEKFNDS